MKNNKIIAIMMTLSMLAAAFAGCLSDDDESNFDEADGGYEYASNVDNHRMLVEDVCDIKELAEAHDWDEIKDIYTNGKHAEKSDGSYRTLQGFADATGKQHGLDTFYGTDSPLDDYLMSALDGTGVFEGASDSVREQAVEKGVQNQIMVAYAIHELNAAINKAAAGNFGTDDAQHAWDEGWAFYHGLDEYASCSPYATGDKRAGNYATANADGTAVANAAILQAMNDGLAALQAQDADGYNAAANEVVRNVIIAYSQAILKYTYKMDSTSDAAKYQAEGYAFWKTIEAYVADATDACYNNKTHTMAYVGNAADGTVCDNFSWYDNAAMGPSGGTFTGCYNMVSHTVATGVNETQCNEGFGAVGSTGMPMYYDNYGATQMNAVLDLTDSTQLGTSYDVSAWLAPAWSHYGITSDDIGSYS